METSMAASIRETTDTEKERLVVGVYAGEMLDQGFRERFILIRVANDPIKAGIGRATIPSKGWTMKTEVTNPCVKKKLLKELAGSGRISTTLPFRSTQDRIEIS
ncbi:hypothetical protein V6N13_107054 [Hibiscus sabdariffa]